MGLFSVFGRRHPSAEQTVAALIDVRETYFASFVRELGSSVSPMAQWFEAAQFCVMVEWARLNQARPGWSADRLAPLMQQFQASVRDWTTCVQLSEDIYIASKQVETVDRVVQDRFFYITAQQGLDPTAQTAPFEALARQRVTARMIQMLYIFTRSIMADFLADRNMVATLNRRLEEVERHLQAGT